MEKSQKFLSARKGEFMGFVLIKDGKLLLWIWDRMNIQVGTQLVKIKQKSSCPFVIKMSSVKSSEKSLTSQGHCGLWALITFSLLC